jgi:hypothetical protein
VGEEGDPSLRCHHRSGGDGGADGRGEGATAFGAEWICSACPAGRGAPLLWERAQDPWPPPRALQLRITAEAAHHGGSGDRGSERDRLDGDGAVGGVVLQFPISWIGDDVGGFRFS